MTSSDYRFQARPFELISTQSTCDGCAGGCEIRVDVKNNTVRRRLAGDDPTHNEEWLCDRGRYGFRSTQMDDRITTPLVRVNGKLVPTSWPEALDAVAKGIRGLVGSQTAVIPGGRLTLENAYAYSRFARTVLGTNNIDFRTRPMSDEETRFLVREQAARSSEQLISYADLEQVRSVILVGFEPEEESPMVYLRLRRAVRRNGLQVVAVAPYLSKGNRKLQAQLAACPPGQEANVLAALSQMANKNTIILVGERAATTPGVLRWVSDAQTAASVKLAWIPRRPGELAAIATGCLPTLLPGGRVVTDGAAQADLMMAWQAETLPSSPGYDLNNIFMAAAAGEINAIITGALDLRDLANSELVATALRQAFMVSLEVRYSEAVSYADVVLPVAAFDEQTGTFIDWTHTRRPVTAAVKNPDATPDVRVLSAIAEALGSSLGFRTTAEALASYDSLNPWSPDPATVPPIVVS